MAWMPYSPNVTRVPPLAAPERSGWCCLRCLTLRGISMVRPPSQSRAKPRCLLRCRRPERQRRTSRQPEPPPEEPPPEEPPPEEPPRPHLRRQAPPKPTRGPLKQVPHWLAGECGWGER